MSDKVIEKLKEFNRKIEAMTPEEVSALFIKHKPVGYVEGQFDRLLYTIKREIMETQVLRLDDVWMPLIANEIKISSIHVGAKKISVGPCSIRSTQVGGYPEINVIITKVTYRPWSEVQNGFITHHEGLTKDALGAVLEYYYKTPLYGTTMVSIIEFTKEVTEDECPF